MNAEEKKVAQNLMKALQALPDAKREYLLGFADGVIAMGSQNQQKKTAS